MRFSTKTKVNQNHYVDHLPFFDKEKRDPFFKRETGNSFFSPKTLRPKLKTGLPNEPNKLDVATDVASVKTIQQLKKQAFLSGKEAYFNRGKHTRASTNGKRSLAHEMRQSRSNTSLSLQLYPVPAKTKCNKLAGWLTNNSPYAPEWAETKVTYNFVPSSFGNVQYRSTAKGTVAKVRGNRKTKIKMNAPIDMPKWNPSKRPNRKGEIKAWKQMIKSLRIHERQHRKIGKVWRKKLRNRARNVSFEVIGINRSDAEAKAVTELARRSAQWQADAQAAHDAFDNKTNHGRKAVKGFPVVKIKCP